MQNARARRLVVGLLVPLVLVPIAGCGRTGAPESSPTFVSAPALSVSGVPGVSVRGGEPQQFAHEFKELERKYGARLGVYAVDSGTGREVAYNDSERFPYASTFKALAAGAVLRTYSLKGMERVISYSADDLVAHSPVTEKHVDTGMTLGELCDAAVRFSDNTAANLLFDELGGPKGLDAVLEELGDDVTRMNRYETELNDWSPRSTRDTSTPRAFAKDLRAFVLGNALSKAERAQLTTWLQTNTTGGELIRAGMPKDWVVGDKAGAGSTYGTRNDIAVVWPPDSAPIVLAIMTNRKDKDAVYDNALIAEAASVVADTLS